jgi:uncharacterized protein
VIRTHAFVLERAPLAYPTLLRAAVAAERGLDVAVVVGSPGDPAAEALARAARLALAPEAAVVRAAPDDAPAELDSAWLQGRGLLTGRAAAYLCRGATCSLPLVEPAALAEAARLGA